MLDLTQLGASQSQNSKERMDFCLIHTQAAMFLHNIGRNGGGKALSLANGSAPKTEVAPRVKKHKGRQCHCGQGRANLGMKSKKKNVLLDSLMLGLEPGMIIEVEWMKRGV